MEYQQPDRPESDRSEDEKNVTGAATVPADLLDDPDAHLSETERAEIVSCSSSPN